MAHGQARVFPDHSQRPGLFSAPLIVLYCCNRHRIYWEDWNTSLNTVSAYCMLFLKQNAILSSHFLPLFILSLISSFHCSQSLLWSVKTDKCLRMRERKDVLPELLTYIIKINPEGLNQQDKERPERNQSELNQVWPSCSETDLLPFCLKSQRSLSCIWQKNINIYLNTTTTITNDIFNHC